MSNVIIIGGSSGLGKEIGTVCVESGAHVVSFSRHTNPSIDLTNLTDKSISNLLDHTTDMTHLFLVAGVGFQGDLSAQSLKDIDTIIKTAITGPLQLLSKILARQHTPLHVVTITSTTSFKVRDNETTYGAAKAGQAQMARNLHAEMIRRNPNAKSTLIHPGGMQTPFWNNTDTDTSAYLNAAEVADIIWREVTNQSESWKEFSIIRQNNSPKSIQGTPTIQFP